MLAEALRLLRVFHDLKQKDVAAKLGVSTSHISELEKGHKTPSVDMLKKYSELFKVPVSSIMFFAEQLDKPNACENKALNVKRAIASKIVSFLQIIEQRTEARESLQS